MIGIAFLTVIGLWIAFAVFSGRKVAAWLDRQDPPRAWLRYAWMTFFVFLPVMDEVIAYPQVMLICQKAKDSFWYDKTAIGKEASKYSYALKKERLTAFPSVRLTLEERGEKLIETNMPAMKWTIVEIKGGFLNFPNGSAMQTMPIILPERCPSLRWSRQAVENMTKKLNLRYVDVDLSFK